MAGVDGFGTLWKIEFTLSSGTFTTVADVSSVDALDVDVDTIDVSSHSSASQWREFLNGMIDGGELSMDVNYDPALHDTIWQLVGGSFRNMKITLPDAGVADITFKGLVKGFTAQAPFDDKLSATITIKVTGAITIAL